MRIRPSPLTLRSRTLAMATSNESMLTAMVAVFSCSASAATTTAATALSRVSSPLVAARWPGPTGAGGPGGAATGADCASAGTVARQAASSRLLAPLPGGVDGRTGACMGTSPVERLRAPMRSAFADDIDSRRRGEREGVAVKARIALPVAEVQFGALAQRIDDLHPHQALVGHAEPGRLERRLVAGLARLEQQPLQAFVLAGLLDDEVAVEPGRIEQRGQRGVLLRPALRPAADLFEVGIVDPVGAAVGHDQLRIRFAVFPAEQPWRGHRHPPAGRLAHPPAVIEHLPGELAVQG